MKHNKEELEEIFMDEIVTAICLRNGDAYDKALIIKKACDKYYSKQNTNQTILALLSRIEDEVIGSDERIDIQSEFDKKDVPHIESDRYPGLDAVRQASRNILKRYQRQSLNKIIEEVKGEQAE